MPNCSLLQNIAFHVCNVHADRTILLNIDDNYLHFSDR